MSKITGYAVDELLDRDARFLYLSDADYERVARERYAQIRAQGLGVFETRFRRKDGRSIEVCLRWSPMDRQDARFH